MLTMPSYWNSPYYNKDKNELNDNAPERLKNEFTQRESQETVTKGDLEIVKEY